MKFPFYPGLIIIIILLTLSNVSAQELLPAIKIKAGIKADARELIQLVERQSGLKINYRSQDLRNLGRFQLPDSIWVSDAISILCRAAELEVKVLSQNQIVLVKVKKKASRSLSGFIRDSESGIPLPGAYIVDLKTGKTVYANEEGFYHLHVNDDSIFLQIFFSGYTSNYIRQGLEKSRVLNIALNPGVLLKEAVVEARRDSQLFIQHDHFTVLSNQTQKRLPALLGQNDALNHIGLLPGIHSLRDIHPGWIVRGGGPDQNMILMDGVLIYNPTHLFGLISVIDGEIMQSMRVYKDAFPAGYAGRLSSVLDVKLRNGHLNKLKFTTSLGLLSMGLVIEGPIKKGKSSFLISSRRSITDLWLIGLQSPIENYSGINANPGFFFYDVNLKLNHQFNAHSYLQLSAYTGADRGGVKTSIEVADSTNLTEITNFRTVWQSHHANLKWVYHPKSRILHQSNLYISDYSSSFRDFYQSTQIVQQKNSELLYELRYSNGIRDLGFKYEAQLELNQKSQLRWGFWGVQHRFNPGTNRYVFQRSGQDPVDTSSSFRNVQATELNVFISHNLQIKRRWKLEYGVHQSFYRIGEKWYGAPQPRLASSFMILPGLIWLADISRMVQFIHLLPNNNLGLPFDVWLPVTEKLKPFNSFQVSTGMKGKYKNWELNLDVYQKWQSQLLEFKDGANLIFSSENWENELESGNGLIRGAEIMIGHQNKKHKFWVSYALSKSERIFEKINDGEAFPYKYDRRHQFTLAFSRNLSKNSNINCNWVYLSGNPVTIPEIQYVIDLEGNTYPVELIGKRNNYRMPAYHRLDISYNRSYEKKYGIWNLDFGVYNLYNQMNPYFLYFGYNSNAERSLRQRSLLPILPSFQIKYQFK